MKSFKYKNIEYKLKSNWKDITLGDYYELKKDKSLIHVFNILTGIPKKEIRNMSPLISEKIMKEIDFFWNQDIPDGEIYLEIDNQKYVCDFDEMQFGQWIDIEDFQSKGIEKNMHNIIAILIKPITVDYSDYDWKGMAEKVKNHSIVNINKILDFFLYIQKISSSTLLKYTDKKKPSLIQ